MESANGSSNDSRTIRSVDRAFEILNLIKRMDGGRVTEIASRIGMEPGSLHPYLMSMEKQGYLVKKGNNYHVGIRFLSLGGYARQQTDIYQITRKRLDELAQETGSTVRLVVENNNYCITMYQVSPLDTEATGTYEGFEEVLHSTAAGKAILAEWPEERVRSIIDERGLPARTPNTIVDESELMEELDVIRSQGYAVDDQECFENVICVADSIKTSEHNVLGAVSVSDTLQNVSRDTFLEEIPSKLLDSTGVIEIDYTYSVWG